MRTIIAGSRNATLLDTIRAVEQSGLAEWMSVVVSGTCRGADMHGEYIANQLGIPIDRYPANWDKYGKSAGYKRNTEMSKNANALIAVYFPGSKGTKHMIDIAVRAGLDVVIYDASKNSIVDVTEFFNESYIKNVSG